ncbi:MAG TPA: alpha/beta hydrolase [Methylomirabilota bacterium]|jgi:pimeloyl-ACP methyl ester carboxylesterase|nr:alpha/beta hydrolase [Methylomirabilota bacterium]
MTTRAWRATEGTRRGAMALLVLTMALLATACSASPVRVIHEDAADTHRRLIRSALSHNELSTFSHTVLLETDLDRRFDADPEKALQQLHDIAVSGSGGPNQLFAVAEASFLHAERTGDRSYYLAAAIYAWTYLFPEDKSETPNPFDPRFGLAANLYNRGLTSSLESDEGRKVLLRGGIFPLPFGEVTIKFDRAQLQWQGRGMIGFTPVAEYRVVGLHAYYREPGLGAPLAASLAPLPGETRNDLLLPELTIGVTAILRPPGSRTGLAWPPLEGTLEVHIPEMTGTVDVAGQAVPLESEPTAVFAYSLADSPVWGQEYTRFFQAISFGSDQSQLYASVPHRHGRIPVVFVHGTASSFGRWAEMYNRLASDPRLRARYEFWFFSYDSGSPVTWSAMLLRESLQRAVRTLDPTGSDPGMQQMVVIGHSQGGLLTKMTVIDSGTRFWDKDFSRPLESLDLSPETRDLLQRSLFVKPLPFVKRVMFLATPHHGSELSAGRIARWVIGFIKSPLALAGVMADLARNRDALILNRADAKPRIPTSIDQMNPHNRFLRTLASIPLVPGVAANSIIAVQGDGPVEDGSDGVVAYRSAHIDGVESEAVVRSPHSLQDNPETVEEVRRVLLLHDTPSAAP